MRILAVSFVFAVLVACSESQTTARTPAAPVAPAATAIARPDASGVVKIEATREGFTPSRIEAKAGRPVKLIFTRTEKKTCMAEAVFPDLDIRKELPLNEPVEVTVTPEAGKEIVFQCPMGMGRSTIVGVE